MPSICLCLVTEERTFIISNSVNVFFVFFFFRQLIWFSLNSEVKKEICALSLFPRKGFPCAASILRCTRLSAVPTELSERVTFLYV